MMRWLSRLVRPHQRLPATPCADLTDDRTRADTERRVLELERLAYLQAMRDVQERRHRGGQ